MLNRIRIPWTIKDLVTVIVLRILLLYLLVRLVYPIFYIQGINPSFVELTDRFLMIILVWGIVFFRYPGGNWGQLGFRGSSRSKTLFWGILGGIILWLVSAFVDFISARFLLAGGYLSSAVELVQQAESWTGLLAPLLVTGIVTPLAEELFYRGLIFQTLKTRLGLAPGVVISSLVFGLFHFNLAWQMIMPFLGGIVLALIFQHSNSLPASIIAHLILNSGKLIAVFVGL